MKETSELSLILKKLQALTPKLVDPTQKTLVRAAGLLLEEALGTPGSDNQTSETPSAAGSRLTEVTTLRELGVDMQQRILLFIFDELKVLSQQHGGTLPTALPTLVPSVQDVVAKKLRLNIKPDVVGAGFTALIESGAIIPIQKGEFDTQGYRLAQSSLKLT